MPIRAPAGSGCLAPASITAPSADLTAPGIGAPFTDVPVIFTSVKEKQRVFKVLEEALEVYENKNRKVNATELNEKIKLRMEQYPHPSVRGNAFKVSRIEQVPARSPTFVFFCNFPNDVRENYRQFLEFYANLAARMHADIFCVGVEFVQMSRYEAEWRKLIVRARRMYSGPLVYGATQGPEFEGIRFWDALDYIGLNNYYPLPDDLSTDAVVKKVALVQQKFSKPVIFPEAGFPSLKDPHREPWSEAPRALSVDDQARCYEAVLRAFYKKPWFQGVYWWKVGTNGRGGPQDGSHTPWGKPAMEVVARWYKQGGR